MALLVVLGWAAVCAAPAGAVFPGATGGLIVSSKLYDPPGTTPALAFSMHDVRFSPDASQVVGVMGSGSSASIWVANADGSNARQLTTPAPGGEADSGPTWSPDGKQIAYVRTPVVSCGNQSGCIATQLEDVNVATGVMRDITAAVYLTSYMTPDWSPDPDSHELVDVVTPNDGPNEIDLINTDTGARTTLAPNAGTPGYFSVRFAPDGKSVVAARGLPEDPLPNQIQVIPLPGLGGPSMTFPLHGSSVSLSHPTFTPDGQWVSFYDCRPGCGIWSASIPQPTDPPGTQPTFREDLVGSFFSLSLDWAPLINEPVITAGPSGRVGSSSAAFEFSIPSTDPGKYQCRIDQGAWEDDCKSPKEYSRLADGKHTFDVRFYGPDEDPNTAPITSRTWTSDTTPPEALIDQAPSGRTDSTDATVVFHSTEPDGATFECSQDGGPEYDCSSPQKLSGLGDGTHTFAIRAIDDVGNEQQSPTRVSWQLTEPSSTGGGGGGGSPDGGGGPTGGTTPPETPTSDCGNGRFTQVAVGSVVAEGRGATCFVRTRKSDGSVVWTAAGPISLNGVELVPSGVIRFDQKLSNLVMQMPAGTTLGFGSFTWTVPSSVRIDLTTHFVMPNPTSEFKIAGLEVAAQPDFSLSNDNGGSATVTVNLELPEIFQGAAGDENETGEPEGAAGDNAEKPQGAKGLTFAFSSSPPIRRAFGSRSRARSAPPGCSARSSSRSSPSGWTPGHR
jgi:WD40 repeat protein